MNSVITYHQLSEDIVDILLDFSTGPTGHWKDVFSNDILYRVKLYGKLTMISINSTKQRKQAIASILKNICSKFNTSEIESIKIVSNGRQFFVYTKILRSCGFNIVCDTLHDVMNATKLKYSMSLEMNGGDTYNAYNTIYS